MAADAHDLADERRHRSPGFRAVWPGLGLLLLVGALAYAALPSVRDQAALSLSRRDAPFVELSAVPIDDSHVGTTCRRGRRSGTTEVVFALRSHLRDRETLRYQMAVTRPEAGDDTMFGTRTFDKVNIDPGVTRTVSEDLAVPRRGAYDLHVRLAGTDQYLVLHCAAP